MVAYKQHRPILQRPYEWLSKEPRHAIRTQRVWCGLCLTAAIAAASVQSGGSGTARAGVILLAAGLLLFVRWSLSALILYVNRNETPLASDAKILSCCMGLRISLLSMATGLFIQGHPSVWALAFGLFLSGLLAAGFFRNMMHYGYRGHHLRKLSQQDATRALFSMLGLVVSLVALMTAGNGNPWPFAALVMLSQAIDCLCHAMPAHMQSGSQIIERNE